jgi:hypothetical protein
MEIRAQAKTPLSLDDAAPSLERRGGVTWELVEGFRNWMVCTSRRWPFMMTWRG